MFRSVRSRLTIWYCAVLAVVLASFGAVSYLRLAREARAETDASLAETAREFAAAFSRQEPESGDGVALDFRLSDRSLLVLRPDGAVVASSRSREANEAARREIARRIALGARGAFTVERPGRTPLRVLATPLTVLSRPYVVAVARDLGEQESRLSRIAEILFGGIPVALLVAGAGGYLLARYGLAPVLRMSRKAEAIGASSLAERIEVPNPSDELGVLASTLNDLLARLEDAFAVQRRFMADASHELRTPIAIIQGEADVALSRDRRSPDDYREAFRIVQATAQDLGQIVEDLLLLSRGDAGGYRLRPARFYLDETVADVARALQTRAGARGVSLRAEALPETLVLADEELVHRLVLNLLDNAVKYTRPGSAVTVGIERAEGVFRIQVRDQGPGIPAEDRQRIFDRFFRSRREEEGGRAAGPGAGLGLAIARWIARVHGGDLTLAETGPHGSTFVAELRIDPLAEA